MRSILSRSFVARSALLALGAMLGASACFSTDPAPDFPVPIDAGSGGGPCPNACEGGFVAVSSSVGGFPLCTPQTASQDCFDGDACTKDICLFGGCTHAPSKACTGPGALVFAEGYGITDAPRKISVAAGPSGTTVVAALFSDSVLLTAEGPIGSFGSSLLVRKLDAQGQPFWTRVFKGAGGVDTVAVAVDGTGAVFLAGSFLDGPFPPIDFGGPPLAMFSSHETAFVAKLDTTGNHVWSNAVPGTSSSAVQSVALDAKGDLAVSGTMQGDINFGNGTITAGEDGAFVALLDTDGQPIWSRAFVSPAVDAGYPGHRLAFAPSGDLVVAGSFLGKADVGAGLIGTDKVQGSFVTRLDALGATVWSDALSSPDGAVTVQGAAVDGAGAILVSGAFSGTADFGAGLQMTTGPDDHDLFVFALGTDGKLAWSRTFGDAADQPFCTVAAGAAGEVLIAGAFQGELVIGTSKLSTTSTSDQDVFVGALDASGQDLWGRRFGDFHQQGATSLAADAQGHLVLGGFFLGPIDFGGGPLLASTLTVGSFVAKLAP